MLLYSLMYCMDLFAGKVSRPILNCAQYWPRWKLLSIPPTFYPAIKRTFYLSAPYLREI
jgi:hypothetical protein